MEAVWRAGESQFGEVENGYVGPLPGQWLPKGLEVFFALRAELEFPGSASISLPVVAAMTTGVAGILKGSPDAVIGQAFGGSHNVVLKGIERPETGKKLGVGSIQANDKDFRGHCVSFLGFGW